MRLPFILASADYGTRLEIRESSLSGASQDQSFVAALTAGPVIAAIDVYEYSPKSWTAYFRDLAENWRGWSGARVRESIEGQLRLSSTCDRTGHIACRVLLQNQVEGADWRVEVPILLEAGQLQSIARAAEQFFG